MAFPGTNPAVERYLRQHCTDHAAVQRRLRDIPVNADAATAVMCTSRRAASVHDREQLLKHCSPATCTFAAGLRDGRVANRDLALGASRPPSLRLLQPQWNPSPKVVRGVDPLHRVLESELRRRGYFDPSNGKLLRNDHSDCVDHDEVARLQAIEDARYAARQTQLQTITAQAQLGVLIDRLSGEERAARNAIAAAFDKRLDAARGELLTAAFTTLLAQESAARAMLVQTHSGALRSLLRAAADSRALISGREEEAQQRAALLREIIYLRGVIEEREALTRQDAEADEVTARRGLASQAAASAAVAAAALRDRLERAAREAAALREAREREEWQRRFLAEAAASRTALEAQETGTRADELLGGEAIERQVVYAQIEETLARQRLAAERDAATSASYSSWRTALDAALKREQQAQDQRAAAEKALRDKAQRMNKPFLGIALAERADGGGLLVDAIYIGGPSHVAGVELGDELLAVEGVPIKTLAEMRVVVSQRAVMGGKLGLTIRKPPSELPSDDPDEAARAEEARVPIDVTIIVMTSDKQFESLTDIYFDTASHTRLTRDSQA